MTLNLKPNLTEMVSFGFLCHFSHNFAVNLRTFQFGGKSANIALFFFLQVLACISSSVVYNVVYVINN